jgi:hypothetical protein
VSIVNQSAQKKSFSNGYSFLLIKLVILNIFFLSFFLFSIEITVFGMNDNQSFFSQSTQQLHHALMNKKYTRAWVHLSAIENKVNQMISKKRIDVHQSQVIKDVMYSLKNHIARDESLYFTSQLFYLLDTIQMPNLNLARTKLNVIYYDLSQLKDQHQKLSTTQIQKRFFEIHQEWKIIEPSMKLIVNQQDFKQLIELFDNVKRDFYSRETFQSSLTLSRENINSVVVLMDVLQHTFSINNQMHSKGFIDANTKMILIISLLTFLFFVLIIKLYRMYHFY